MTIAVASSPSGSPDDAHRRTRVLAVDDDGLILMNTVAMLEDMGLDVLEARSAEDALMLTRLTEDLDLLITDQAMTGMSGLDLARQLASERPRLPVMLATGYGNEIDDVPDSMVILSKPFDHHALAAAISQALGVPGAD